MNRLVLLRLLTVSSGVATLMGLSTLYFGSIEGLALYLQGQRLFAERSSLDIGTVSVSKETIIEYKILNKSNHAVEIAGGKASCSCAAPENLPITIPAFDSVILPVRYKPPEHQIGSTAHNSVNLFLSNGQNPLRLSFKATITE
jgi:hypothetical protein